MFWPRCQCGCSSGLSCSGSLKVGLAKLKLGKGSWVHQGPRTCFGLGRTRPEERVDGGGGVTAASYGTDVRSGDGLRPNSKLPHQGAIRDQRLTKTGSNSVSTDQGSVGHRCSFSAELRTGEGEIVGCTSSQAGLSRLLKH
jgi:hypothetical protein